VFIAFTSSVFRPTRPSSDPDEGVWKLAKEQLYSSSV
jgi:hypothetical protein